jgi:hypothetical protein
MQSRDTQLIADNCTPPSHTKITHARINNKKQIASFSLTAPQSTSVASWLARRSAWPVAPIWVKRR